MKAQVKRGRPRKGDAAEKVLHVGVSKDTMARIEAFQAAQTVETSLASVHRYLILKGLDAAEKEAARG